jgi:flavin-dependent dehydrogenase
MAEARKTDVLVIGGGPAGLSAAIGARLAGFDTLVIERCRPPIDAACGEGVMPAGVERLRDLGVEIPERDRAVFRGIRYLDGKLTAEALFKRGVGLGIRRSILHDALYRRAMEVGVEIRWGEKALGLGPRGIETCSGLLSASWMVAADGRDCRWSENGRVSRAAPRSAGASAYAATMRSPPGRTSSMFTGPIRRRPT